MRLELTAFRLWDWRAAYCATEAVQTNCATVDVCEIYSKVWISRKKGLASAGNRTRVNCLEGSYAHHYTTNAQVLCTPREKWRKVLRKRLLKLECVYSLPKGTFPYFFSIRSPWLSLRTVTTSSFLPSSQRLATSCLTGSCLVGEICGPGNVLALGLFTFRRPLGHIEDGESNGAVGFGLLWTLHVESWNFDRCRGITL